MIFQGNKDLQKLRYMNYMKMAASSSKINASKLPHTERAAQFYSLRTYLEVWEWKTLKDGPLLEVTDWGWIFENREAVPIMTDQVILFHYSRYRGAVLFFFILWESLYSYYYREGGCFVINLGDSQYPYYEVIKYEFCCPNYLNPNVPNVKFLYPLETLEKSGGFLMFPRYIEM